MTGLSASAKQRSRFKTQRPIGGIGFVGWQTAPAQQRNAVTP
jgi:hypothetical protein